jgi:hypothetical protein
MGKEFIMSKKQVYYVDEKRLNNIIIVLVNVVAALALINYMF